MKKTIVLNSEFMGRGDDELGAKLTGSLLRTLVGEAAKPDTIIFYNSAVKLLAEGSVVLDVLNDLHKAGVRLVACGTCVSHFKLDEKIAHERVSNMKEIAGILMSAENVVTI